jgi:Reverse transcriptase (RNA-dependent DNA polymerase)
LLKNRLYHYFKANNFLHAYQFAFRHDHSTVLALIDVIDSLYERMDNNKKVIGIYLDLKKALDTVNHDLLLYKLVLEVLCLNGLGIT